MVVTPSNKITFLRLVQLLNRLPLSVLGPKVTSSKFSQFSKTQSPKEMTLLGIEAEIRLLQLEYLQPIITQYFIDNKSEIWLLFLIAHSKR